LPRSVDDRLFINRHFLGSGLTVPILSSALEEIYKVLDLIDDELLDNDSDRLSRLVELANLSSIIGNLFAAGVVRASDGVFDRPATGHKYQDLRTTGLSPTADDIEIKVALESNTPKGHLAKAGPYLTCRYVLGDANGEYRSAKRGDVVWVWELRYGHLSPAHFNLSNTPGDSGKTAVVNRSGMELLKVVYFDAKRCPYGPKSRRRLQMERERQEALELEQTIVKVE
jgi:hypothetical protein